MSERKIMTFNIRVPSDQDGENHARFRSERILSMLRREEPDVIGFQEVTDDVWDWLEQALLPDYCLLGCGRYADCRGEGTPIAFRRDRFRLHGMERFWLSDTPRIPGSRYEGSDQSHCPRMAVSLLLQERETGAFVTVVNTHTDHRGEQSRILAMRQLLEYLRSKQGHRILMGDLNALPDSEEICTFRQGSAPLGIQDVSADSGVTFHGFGHAEHPAKIDYLFTDLPAVECHAVSEHPTDGLYYSDHYAIVATLRFSDLG